MPANLPEVGAENMPPPIGGLGTTQKPNIPPAPASWDDDLRAISIVMDLAGQGDVVGAKSFWSMYRQLKGWN